MRRELEHFVLPVIGVVLDMQTGTVCSKRCVSVALQAEDGSVVQLRKSAERLPGIADDTVDWPDPLTIG